MGINVGANVVSPSHDISLSDGTTTIGLILCDKQGRANPLAGFSQSPMPGTAMKFSQGQAGYEDFELPFSSIEMQNWIGGMLAKDFEDDRTMYKDGRFVDTTQGDIVCGPKETQTTAALADPPGSFIFYEYKRSLYVLVNKDDGSAPLLYRNGYRGAAKSNSADKLKLNTDQNLPAGTDLAGCVAVIIEGPGSKEEQPWRKVVSNTTGVDSVITVDSAWKIAHTTATSWVVLGSDDWIQITSTGLTKKVTSIVTVKDYVMFAQGDGAYINKIKEYNNAGTWTMVRADDGTNKADILIVIQNDEGVLKVWRAFKISNKVSSSDVKDWGTAHVFENEIIIGNSNSHIVNMVAYGEPQIPYVFKEDGFGSIKSNIYAQIPIGEMASLRSEYNGIAAMTFGVYLYFSMAEKIERYYDRRLNDVGPDGGEGLPEARQGIIRKLLPYPGRYYALLYSDGGTSSIMCFNNYGWHEIWRGVSVAGDVVTDVTGQRNSDMIVQVVPGSIDRMWFDWGGKLCRIPIALRPRNATGYRYRDLSQLETAWIYGNLKDVKKYWHSIKLHTENLSAGQTVKVEYKVDEDTDWTTVGTANTSPIEELDLSPSYNVSGYRIKFRFTLRTTDSSKTPRIIAAVVKCVIRVDVKRGWSVTALTSPDKDKNGNPDHQVDLVSQLYKWADSDEFPAPLTLRHNLPYYDDVKVFIEAASVAPLLVKLEPVQGQNKRVYKEIVSFTTYEV